MDCVKDTSDHLRLINSDLSSGLPIAIMAKDNDIKASFCHRLDFLIRYHL